MANVFDAAAYILEKQGAMTAMMLQKLVYYAQAWSLVWDQRPLFGNKIEAWANGPVCPRTTMNGTEVGFRLNPAHVQAIPVGSTLTSAKRFTLSSPTMATSILGG